MYTCYLVGCTFPQCSEVHVAISSSSAAEVLHEQFHCTCRYLHAWDVGECSRSSPVQCSSRIRLAQMAILSAFPGADLLYLPGLNPLRYRVYAGSKVPCVANSVAEYAQREEEALVLLLCTTMSRNISNFYIVIVCANVLYI